MDDERPPPLSLFGKGGRLVYYSQQYLTVLMYQKQFGSLIVTGSLNRQEWRISAGDRSEKTTKTTTNDTLFFFFRFIKELHQVKKKNQIKIKEASLNQRVNTRNFLFFQLNGWNLWCELDSQISQAKVKLICTFTCHFHTMKMFPTKSAVDMNYSVRVWR